MNTNGINTTLQIGREATWGAAAVATQNLNFLGESFTMDPELLEEDSVIGNISGGSQDLVAINVKGGFDVILKPENAVALFALAFGVQATPVLHALSTDAWDHTITPVGASVALPSFKAVVDRKLQCKSYSGCVISSFELTAKAKDYVRCKVAVECRSEATETLVALTNPSKKAFRFANGSCLIDGVAFADITAVTFAENTNFTKGEQTLGSGLYPSEGGHGVREFTVSLEMKYTTQANTLIESNYKVGDPVSVVLNFDSPELVETGINHSFRITMPNVMITGGLPNISGKDDMKVTIAGMAKELGGVTPCTVLIVSDIDAVF